MVRGFIGIYAVLTDRMERPIGQSKRFFIIVLDTVILLAFDQCLLYFIKPITNPRGVKIMSVSFKRPLTCCLMSLQAGQYIYSLLSSSSFYGYILERKWLGSSKGELTLKSKLTIYFLNNTHS